MTPEVQNEGMRGQDKGKLYRGVQALRRRVSIPGLVEATAGAATAVFVSDIGWVFASEGVTAKYNLAIASTASLALSTWTLDLIRRKSKQQDAIYSTIATQSRETEGTFRRLQEEPFSQSYRNPCGDVNDSEIRLPYDSPGSNHG